MKYKLSNGLEYFWQWDINQSIILPIGIPTVHFKWGENSIKVSSTSGVFHIPDELLQVADDLIFYTYNKDHTIDGSFIKIYTRPKPDGYAYTPTEVKTWEQLDERIAALEQGGGVAGVTSVNGKTGTVELTAEDVGAATNEDVTSAVKSATENLQPKGDYITQDGLQSATDKALAQAKASGEFDGAPGAEGPKGPAGATPVKGTDYWTASDQAAIVQDTLAALPTWTGGSY